MEITGYKAIGEIELTHEGNTVETTVVTVFTKGGTVFYAETGCCIACGAEEEATPTALTAVGTPAELKAALTGIYANTVGFLPGHPETPEWATAILEEMAEMLEEVAPYFG